MRIGYVFIPLFPIEVERRRNPDLIDKPVIVGGYPYERKPVFAASAECREMGVNVGMPLRQAHLLCPEAVFLAVDSDALAIAVQKDDAYESAYEDFLAVLDCFSPAVERDELGAAYVDAEGLRLLFGEERELGRKIIAALRTKLGMVSRVAFGPGRFVARVATQLEPGTPDQESRERVGGSGAGASGNPPRAATPHAGVTIIEKGESLKFLSGLSVAWLRLGEESGERLRMLGIRTIGQFMRLPAQSLMERLGPDAVAARRTISNEEKDAVVPRAVTAFLERSVVLDYPIETIKGFSLVARDLVAFLVAQLQRRYQACQTVTLCAEFENGRTREDSIQLKEPTATEGDLIVALERLASRISRGGRPCPPGLEWGISSISHQKLDKAPTTGRTGPSPDPSVEGPGSRGVPTLLEVCGGIVAMKVVLGGLIRPVSRQLGFFDAQPRRRAYLDRALDEIQERFGERVRPGITLARTTTHTTRGRAAHPAD